MLFLVPIVAAAYLTRDQSGSYDASQGNRKIDCYQIWDQITHGPGPGSIDQGQQAATRLKASYNDRVTTIDKLSRDMDAAWQGKGAAAAQDAGAHPLKAWMQDSGTKLADSDKYLGDQHTAFTTVAAKVQEVPQKPPGNGFLNSITPWETDTDRAIKDYNRNGQANVDAFNEYFKASSTNGKGLPTYSALDGSVDKVDVSQDGKTGKDDGKNGDSGTGDDRNGNGSGYQPGNLPGGGGNQPGNIPGGGGYQPGNIPGGSGYQPGNIPGGGGYNPSNIPAAGYQPGNIPGGSYQPGNIPGSSGYTPSGIPGGTTAAGYTPPNIPGADYSGGGGFGPGGSGSGGFGAGGFGPGGTGSGGLGVGGFGPGTGGFGPGSSSGAALPGSGMAGTGSGAGGSGAGGGAAVGKAGASGMSGMGGMQGGKGGKGGEDEERSSKYLMGADPNDLFGTDELTAPPVIGE
jgi:hypothetical protein